MQDELTTYDIVIVGAGPAGLCFAASLESSGLRIAIVEKLDDAHLADPAYDGREIALTLRSERLLRALGIWSLMPSSEVAPLCGARIMNGDSSRALNLRPSATPDAEIGFLVSNHLIRRAAYQKVRTLDNVVMLTGASVVSVDTDPSPARVVLDGGRQLQCRLVVAADTRFSQTRRDRGIPARMNDFGKSMLVCRMHHAVGSERVAWEWFGHQQTLALLPIDAHCASIVLTMSHAQVERLQRLPADAFARDIEQRFQMRLGAMSLASERYTYPLVAVYATRFVARRYAVIGDAAVGMHPVTAHGFNFGLLGQDTLASLIIRASRCGGDIADPALLERYERAHRLATLPLYCATNAIVRLYTDDSPPARLARDVLLGIADRVRPIGAGLTHLLMSRGRTPVERVQERVR